MASRPSRSRMTAAWMKADDMNGPDIVDAPFYATQGSSKAGSCHTTSSAPAYARKSPINKGFLAAGGKLESFNSAGLFHRQTNDPGCRFRLLRKPPRLQHRQCQNHNRDRPM